MPDQEYKIAITTTADMGGINNVTDGIKSLTNTQTDEGIATKAATAATEDLTIGKRELLETMRPLIQQFPILGELARSAFSPVTVITFGLIESFELLSNRIDQTADSLGAVQLPDLSDGIRQAQDLATAWDGVAKAVRDADAAFDSVQQNIERNKKADAAVQAENKKAMDAQKATALAALDAQFQGGGMSEAQFKAQKAAIEQQYRDRETQAGIDARNNDLNNQFNSAVNYKLEGDRLKGQADAVTKQFGLGATQEEQAAQKKANQSIIDDRQKSIDESRKNLALLNEATDDQTGELTADFDWAKLIGHYGGGVTTPTGLAQAQAMEQQNIAQQESAQKELARKMAAQDEADKQRDDLLKKSQDSYGKSETARREANYENNPNTQGTTAWQNAQDRATMRQGDIGSGISAFAGDMAQIKSDLSQHGPQSAKTIQDMRDALKLAADTLKNLAGLGADVSRLQYELKRTQAQVRSSPINGSFY